MLSINILLRIPLSIESTTMLHDDINRVYVGENVITHDIAMELELCLINY